MLKLKLIQRLIIFACLLLVLNVVTLHFQSQHQLLETVFSTTDAQGRLNSGTELILRDQVTGIAETGTFESFSNESVRTLMDYFTSNRKARTVVYRPSPISPETTEHNDYELSLAIETRNRWLFISDVTITLFNEQFKHAEHQSFIWFFKWRTL
jgi:hypothetical protein